MSDRLADLTTAAVAFRDARDWAQFHTPRHLAAGLAIEAGELQETMLWKDDAEVEALLADPTARRPVADELADVVIYALLFAERAGIDLAAAVRAKLEQNAAKYPVGASRGRATKYTDL